MGIEQIGLHDNFFRLGGSSLLVGQLLARLHRLFRVSLSVTTIFEHPTIAELAEIMKQSQTSTQHEPLNTFEKSGQQYDEQLLAVVDQLTPEEISALVGKRETLTRLLQAKISGQKLFPLSFAQRRLWFLNQFQGTSPVYHVTVAYRITGELDHQALEKSLNEIVRRHETLRTTFPALDGQPMQMITPHFTVELVSEDLEQLPEEQREAETLRQATNALKRPFDLAAGPLLRTKLLRLHASEHILLLNVHHIIFDGWSMGIFYRELAALYEAFVQGKPSPLPKLPIQYLDYTAWERQKRQSEALEVGLAYWKQQLAGAPPVLELPTDYPRPPLETFRGAYTEFMHPASLIAGLKEIGQREKVTLFVTLLAAFQVLLAHASQQDDIVVGTDAANRSQVEIEDLIGFFVNQLVLRTNLAGNLSLSELLQRIRRVVLGAYEHQYVPFDQLVRVLNPVRFPNRAPIFQAKLVLQNMPVLSTPSPVTIAPLLVDAGAAQLDLILDLTETAAGLRTIWQYNTDLFNLSSIQRMNQQFSTLLQAFVTSPSQTLSALYTLLDEHEDQSQQMRRSLVSSEAVASQPYALSQSNLARAFEEQAERTPDKIALVMQGRTMTYAQLNTQANRLAHRLKALGVQPETMVVLCTERSLETIIGFFGIFKAGGVCVSLDPAYPKDRWTFILQDSQARVAVTQSTLASAFQAYGLAVVELDRLDAQAKGENPISQLEPEHLAYVMYTSGSTGQPKGVGVSHQAALNHCLAVRRA
ncbi:MAG: condensation domain-containing protein, partial [Ktedonobacteraceae bacterium]